MDMAKTIIERMRRQIMKAEPGSVFLVRDFLRLGGRGAVDESLSRLTEQGVVRRVQRGVYERPRHSELLGGLVPPSPYRVADAVARRAGQKIAPTPAQAANALGLTTQIQAKNVFRTNGGKPRRLTVGNTTVELLPSTPGRFPLDESDAVIQALRFVGEGNVTPEIIERLRQTLTSRQKSALRHKWPTAPGWMQEALQAIVQPPRAKGRGEETLDGDGKAVTS